MIVLRFRTKFCAEFTGNNLPFILLDSLLVLDFGFFPFALSRVLNRLDANTESMFKLWNWEETAGFDGHGLLDQPALAIVCSVSKWLFALACETILSYCTELIEWLHMFSLVKLAV